MPFVAIKGDPITGKIAGEHFAHSQHPHPPGLPITGEISGKVSTKVFINDIPVAMVGSTTTEKDDCCGTNNTGGVILTGYSKVIVEDRAIAMVGSEVTPHNGTAYVSGSNQNLVIVG